MKKIGYLIFLILIIPVPLKADVISFPYPGFGTALSLECIGSYELPFTRLNTINIWGGIGAVSMIKELKYPAPGTELAIEFRQYFKNNSFKNLNIGLYAGFTYMRYPYFYREHLSEYKNTVGYVPGLKLTYKKEFNSWLVGEPYMSLSIPMYDNDIGLILTIGIRIGFNKVRIKKE